MTKPKTPVTLVTGYLGSGKTTLVNGALSQKAFGAGGRRVGVIVNEFGAVGIDGALLGEAASSEQVIELANGCLCCVVTGEFKNALELLAERDLDHIVIETSGAADPTSVLKMFWGAPELTRRYRLDGVICVIDGRNHLATITRDPLAALQASVADVHLISKTDSVSKEALLGIRAALKELNPVASAIEFDSMSGLEFPIEHLFKINAYGAQRPARFLKDVPEAVARHGNLTSVSVTWEGAIPSDELQLFFRGLLLDAGVVRTKALILVRGERRPWLIQGVQDWIERSSAPRSYVGPNKLVVLGRDLDVDRLKGAIDRLKQATDQSLA